MRKQGGDEALQNEEVGSYIGIEALFGRRRIEELEQYSCVVRRGSCGSLLCTLYKDDGAQIGARRQGASGDGVDGDDRVIVPFQRVNRRPRLISEPPIGERSVVDTRQESRGVEADEGPPPTHVLSGA